MRAANVLRQSPHTVSVLDLEQYHHRGRTAGIPLLGAPDDTDVSHSKRCQFVQSDEQTIRGSLAGTTVSAGAMVGRGGLEPPTSRLSGVRSNHLSYRPILRATSGDVEGWWSLSGSNR